MEMEFVRYKNMPIRIHGVTIVDEDGNYNIYINSKLPTEMQIAALEHEKEHIRKGHFSECVLMEAVDNCF